MGGDSDSRLEALAKVPRWCGAAGALVGALVLIGWSFEIRPLMQVLPGQVAMVPSTALAFLLAGLALWRRPSQAGGSRARAVRITAAWASGLLGLLNLLEYVTGRSLGLDELLFRDPAGLTAAFPGRMALSTAVSFVLIAAALLLLDLHRATRASDLLVLVPCFLALVSLISYAYGLESASWIGAYKGMAIHTALTILVLSIGVLLARDGGFRRLFASETAGGLVARRVIPFTLIIPFVVGWLHLVGERSGFIGAEMGTSVSVVVNTAVYLAILLAAAVQITRSEEARQHAAAGKRSTEETLRLRDRAIEAVTQGVLITDLTLPGNPIIYANPAFEWITGYSASEVIGRSPGLFQGPGTDPETRDELRRAIGSGSACTVEILNYRKDGTAWWNQLAVSPIRDADGRVTHFVGILIDVTERRKAEMALRESEERVRLLLDSTAEAIYGLDLEGRCTFINTTCLRLLGYTRASELLGRDFHEAAHHSRRDGSKVPTEECRVVQAARRGEGMYADDDVMWRADGTWFPVEYWAHPIGPPGSVIGSVVTFFDVTERRRMEDALRAEKERYRVLFEENPMPMWVSDPQTMEIISANEAAARQYGYSRSEMERLKLTDVRMPGEAERLRTVVAELPPGHIHVGVSRDRRKDGTLLDVDVYLSRLELDGRRTTLAVLHDVTQQKGLEEQLRQAQKMEAVGRLAGGVAHDFNNLLTVISGYGDLLLKSIPKGTPSREPVEQIVAAGDRAARLTRQLLAFSRRQVLEPRVLDLNQVVADIEKMLQRVIGEDVGLVTVLDAGLGRVTADPGQLEQIVMNLAINARDAMPDGGKLTIETRNVELDEAYVRQHAEVRTGPYVMLAVSDTGSGMDEETLSRIFEPFFTTKESDRGTGLGLSTVYGIVEQSGGNIWVYSVPGQGTTFKIYFPRTSEIAESAPPRRPSGSIAVQGEQTVLLIEDDAAVRQLTEAVLAGNGYPVLTASGAEEALRIGREHPGPIHLILSDVVMPETSGPELVARVRNLRPDVRVLFMSGYSDEAISRHGILEPGSAFLAKPFTPASLLAKVREVLRG